MPRAILPGRRCSSRWVPISGRPGGIGSSYAGYYRVARRKIAARFVVTAAERPTLHQVARHDDRRLGPLDDDASSPPASSCDLRVDLEYELPGEIVASLFGMLAGNRIEREFRQYLLKRLKAMVEEEPRVGRRRCALRPVDPEPAGPDDVPTEVAAS